MNIGRIVGKAENGIINEYLTRNFNRCTKGRLVSNLDRNLK
jgi:hypothetical protein